jgi:predicted negative regulator of RcsB-dependent stress response
MVRLRKKISRKDISKPDQFITLTSRVFRFFEQYRTRILLALSLAIAVFLALWGWNLYSGYQERLAAQDYARALATFRSGDYQDALDRFARLSSYRSTTYNQLGLLYRAQSLIALKQPSEAVPILQEFLEKEGENTFLRQLGLITMGYAHENAGQCPEAAKAFKDAQKVSGPLQEEALMGNARCNSKIGNLQEALSAYQDYLTSFPGSSRTTEIRLRIQDIESKMKGASGGN